MATRKNAPTGMHTGNDKWRLGHLHLIDSLKAGDPAVGGAIATYGNGVNDNRQSRHWIRAVQWMENILFSIGRHYVDDILVSRLTRDSNADLSVISETTRNIPRPVNDLLGRYIETNISLLTENRPRPRVTPKSGRAEDEDAAELSELVLEYLWEALKMPEKHREIARTILHCGVCWMETIWDEQLPRRITVPETEQEAQTPLPLGGGTVNLPIERQVPKLDENGNPVYTEQVEYGDVSAKIVSPFEMHLPVGHRWDDDEMPWVMREYYVAKDVLLDKFGNDSRKRGLTKAKGWHLDRLEDVGTYNVKNLPLWWWERLSDIVEGPGPSIYVGTPEQWEGYTVVRWFDRRPNPMWPRGRSIMLAGDEVIYDSPKEVGARAYDPRWPTRWHPYTRFVWEPMMGSMYGRSLVSKLLPKLKRVNAIDTTLIMWRRTVPIAMMVAPKGSQPVDDQWSARPGGVWEYDAQRTNGAEPRPIFAPEYPRSALEERATQIAEMESISGTEEILRGQRPTGVNSAAMINVLRKQALASRSPGLQSWDESLQLEGSHLLQEVIKNVRKDPRYADRIKVLANERKSALTIDEFSGMDVSDNVIVRVDTVSMALVSREARQARAVEVLQYAPALMPLPSGLRAALMEELGYDKEALLPQGAQITRVKRMLAWIRQGNYDRVVPLKYDDPYLFYDLIVQEIMDDAFYNLNEAQQHTLLGLADIYEQQIEMREQQALRLQQLAAGNGAEGEAPPPPQ